MNTGIQDAYNLAWKLALVIRGHANGRLLKTYNEERLENAKHLLRTTDRMFEFAAGTDWLLEFLRTTVLPPIAGYILHFDPVRKLFFPLVSQIGINYRHSSLSQHEGDENFEVKAGDRMPYLLINGKSVFDQLREPKFHWLAFSSTPNAGQTSMTEIERPYADLVDVNEISLNPKVAELFGTKEPFNLLLRPDNHIAFISTVTSPDVISDYLDRFVGYH
jgi:FAD binding domain